MQLHGEGKSPLDRAISSKTCIGSKTHQCPSKQQPVKNVLPLPAPRGPSRDGAPKLSSHHLSPDPSAGFTVPSHVLLPLSIILFASLCRIWPWPLLHPWLGVFSPLPKPPAGCGGVTFPPGWLLPPSLQPQELQSPRDGSSGGNIGGRQRGQRTINPQHPKRHQCHQEGALAGWEAQFG